MLIKRKSLVVAVISSMVIVLVLIVTLAGYSIYIEYKGEEFRKQYQLMLGRVKAGVFSKYITISDLDAKIENSGPLKGKPVIEGTVSNKSGKDISNLSIRVVFLDKENAAIYETEFQPQEPSLGSSSSIYSGIPYLRTPANTALKASQTINFKKVISPCPTEIFIELREGDKPNKSFGRWSGKLQAQIASLDL
jgi:hypothetical protein